MKAACLILIALISLAGCSTPQDDSAGENTLNPQLLELRAELAANQAALSVASSELAEQRARVAELETSLAALRRESAAASARLLALESELDAARKAEKSAADRSMAVALKNRDLESELARQSRAYQEVVEQLNDAALVPGIEAIDPARVADTALVVEKNVDPVSIKRVYYATNRNSLDRQPLDYWKPFMVPVVFAVLSMVGLLLIRRYIKERYQRRFRLTICMVAVVVVLATLGRGAQESLQMLQRDKSLGHQYGNEIRRVEPGEVPYQRGFVDVSIPNKRAIGEVPRPQLIRFELVVDATRHFKLAAVRPASHDGFYEQVNAVIQGDPENSAFVFVHGFHNTFEDAAFRTAQIAHDMQYPGAALFFSWPSQGAVLDYLTDAKNVETSVAHLRAFLEELHRESGASRIHLIAHSMGSRALVQAVEGLSGALPDEGRFGQLVFAAPDIARDLLEQKVLSLARVVEGVTLYASANDAALRLSRALQGETQESYQRAGETYPAPMVAPPMQTVDVSGASTGHSYISDSPMMLRDLAGLLAGSRVLNEGSENYVPAGYWLLQPARD